MTHYDLESKLKFKKKYYVFESEDRVFLSLENQYSPKISRGIYKRHQMRRISRIFLWDVHKRKHVFFRETL